MKGWLIANLFLLGMALFAACFMFAASKIVGLVWTDEDTKRAVIGVSAVAALFVTGIVFRALLNRIERRR